MSHIIAAIATPPGIGGVAIIRVSGEGSIGIINDYVNIDIKKKQANTINYARFYIEGELFDEVLISIFKAPNSYTGEEIVEINSHGGIYVTNEILNVLLKNPEISLAEPGEFSKRAYLNGKKTLSQSEAIDQIINARTGYSHKLAINQFSEKTNILIEKLRQDILAVVAQIEVNIDYPEYTDIEEFTSETLKPKINSYLALIEQIIDDTNKGELFKNGIDTAIVGAPNVGKSTLLNRLARQEKAIVTNIEGTTRDIIETEVLIGNLILNLKDTAGIRKTTDVVESLGIDKSLESLNNSRLVLYLVDQSKKLTDEDVEFYNNNLKDVNHLVIINKCDLESAFKVDEYFDNYVLISAKEDINIDKLETAILKVLNIDSFDPNQAKVLSTIEDVSKLQNTKAALVNVLEGIELGLEIDLLELDIKEALKHLGEILNINYKENLIDELFSRFCLGK